MSNEVHLVKVMEKRSAQFFWHHVTAIAASCVFGCGAPPVNNSGDVTNSSGLATTVAAKPEQAGRIHFLVKPLGSNGRFCESCHNIGNGWVLTPAEIAHRLETGIFVAPNQEFSTNSKALDNDQLDPVFRVNDGTVSPSADVSTASARKQAYALLLSKALVRIGLPIPTSAEFKLQGVDDPYHFASTAELSLFRRTPQIANVMFMTTVMWDGRETSPTHSLSVDLQHQASDATVEHARASAPPSSDVLQQMVSEESEFLFAQVSDLSAGRLDEDGALGGPENMRGFPFYPEINSYPGPDPMGIAYSSRVFSLYDSWANVVGDARSAARRSIFRGQEIFNARAFAIRGVSGLNDEAGQSVIWGTCGTCHNTPGIGNNSDGLLFNIGVADAVRRTSDVPLYTLTNLGTGVTVQTTDPGRALVTGRWKDIGRFKVPTLRGLAARAPFFHDGSAATLSDVVFFLDTRFSIGLSGSERADLIAFLSAL